MARPLLLVAVHPTRSKPSGKSPGAPDTKSSFIGDKHFDEAAVRKPLDARRMNYTDMREGRICDLQLGDMGADNRRRLNAACTTAGKP